MKIILLICLIIIVIRECNMIFDNIINLGFYLHDNDFWEVSSYSFKVLYNIIVILVSIYSFIESFIK